MNIFFHYLERLRFLTLAAMLLLIPIAIDLQITGSLGPETKFRLLEYGVILAALFTLPLYCAGRTTLRLNPASTAIALWIVYYLIRAAVDTQREFAMDLAFRSISWLLFILLAADACPSRRDYLRLVWIAVIGQLGPVILAVGNIFGVDIYLNWIKGTTWRWTSSLIGADRSVIWSSLGNPNYYANYGGLLLIWLCAILACSRRWWSCLLLIGYIITLLVTLVYTSTRGVWASLIPSFFIISGLLTYRQIKARIRFTDLIRIYGKRIGAVTVSFLVIITALFVIESNTGPLHNIARRFQHGLQFRDASLRSRPLLWYAALRVWRESPIWGQGIGRYSPRFLETVYNSAQETDPSRIQHITREMNTIRTDQAHNDYLQILAETGLVGYALFLLFLLSLFSLALRELFSPTLPRGHTILLTGCTAILITTAIQCIYDFPLLLPSSAILFSLAAVGILSLTQEKMSTACHYPAYIRWVISSLFVPVLFVAAYFVLRHLIASHNLDKGSFCIKTGLESMQKADMNNAVSFFQRAERYLQRANRLFEKNGVTFFELGRLYASRAQVENDPRLRARAINQITRANETYCVPESYYLLCKLYLDESMYALAQKASDILLVVDPEREGVHFMASQVDYKAHKFEEAARHLRLELKRHPQSANAMALLGSIEQDQFGNPGEAASLYAKLLDIEPGSVDILKRFADALASMGELEEARKHYESALEGARALSLRDMEKNIEIKLNELTRTMETQEGGLNESRNP